MCQTELLFTIFLYVILFLRAAFRNRNNIFRHVCYLKLSPIYTIYMYISFLYSFSLTLSLSFSLSLSTLSLLLYLSFYLSPPIMWIKLRKTTNAEICIFVVFNLFFVICPRYVEMGKEKGLKGTRPSLLGEHKSLFLFFKFLKNWDRYVYFKINVYFSF